MEAGDDAAIKLYLAGRLAQALLEGSRARGAHGDASGRLEEATARNDELEAAGRALEERLRRHEADHGASRAEAEAAARERLAKEVGALQAQHADELRQERARLAAERDRVAADRDAHADASRKHRDAAAERGEALARKDAALAVLRRTVDESEKARATLDAACKTRTAEAAAADANCRGLELRLASTTQRAEAAEATVSRADAARRLAADAGAAAAASRADAEKRLEARESQLAAASAEITRGNAIIERLAEQARAQQQKLRLRADVVKQQERRVADATKDRDDARHQKDLALATASREADRRARADADLDAARKKLDEARRPSGAGPPSRGTAPATSDAANVARIGRLVLKVAERRGRRARGRRPRERPARGAESSVDAPAGRGFARTQPARHPVAQRRAPRAPGRPVVVGVGGGARRLAAAEARAGRGAKRRRRRGLLFALRRRRRRLVVRVVAARLVVPRKRLVGRAVVPARDDAAARARGRRRRRLRRRRDVLKRRALPSFPFERRLWLSSRAFRFRVPRATPSGMTASVHRLERPAGLSLFPSSRRVSALGREAMTLIGQ